MPVASLSPAIFDPATIDAQTRALNADIVAKLKAAPDPWSVPPALIRERRAQGLGIFPMPAPHPRAHVVTIAGPGGPLDLRVIPAPQPRGLYLHFHGGGWTFGTADQEDDLLGRLGETCGLTCVSVAYRLAPEQPYPAAPDDCEAAALWALREGLAHFGVDRLAIGGESAGAHLAVVTLLRLRDRHGLTPFMAANLNAGLYDMTLTPSAARSGPDRLILDTRDITRFAGSFLQTGENRRDPDISPLYGDLAGLPPALFTVGTADPLLDDSLFMAARWQAAGNTTELAVYPGGCHVFTRFPTALGEQGLARIERFLGAAIG